MPQPVGEHEEIMNHYGKNNLPSVWVDLYLWRSKLYQLTDGMITI
jgi:hypothetical protein